MLWTGALRINARDIVMAGLNARGLQRVARIKDTTVLYPRRENTRRAGRRISVGCTMMRIAKEPFARSASNLEFLVFSVLEGCGSQSPSKIGRKLLKKVVKAHSRSDSHSHATQAMLVAKRAVVDGTVVQQLQNVEAHKRAQNRATMKCLILLTHFLTK